MTFLSTLFGALVVLAGALGLGSSALRRIAAPPEIVLATGGAIESLLIFFVVLAGAGYWPVFLGISAVGTATLWWFRPKTLDPVRIGALAGAIFGIYGIFYLVNALAPEILADGITYHLGLPYEYVRRGGFSPRIAFYELLPQGMEMLFTMAFAFGRHSAAKLVEFAFFVAGIPLLFRIGRRLRMSDGGTVLAAAFYFTAPVIAVTGTSSYNDAALVFFSLAVFYLLLVWRDTGDDRYLLPAGLLAGFCYAIKMPGIVTAVGAGLFIAARRPRRLWLLAAGAAVAIAPWMIRSAVLTGDPLAPLATGIFPNPYFRASTEVDLANGLKSLHAVKPTQIPWELAFGDHFAGTYGPLLFVLPLGLLAMRKRDGALCLAAAALLALPWFSNTGARFLMASFVFAAIALGIALPKPAAWAAIALQVVMCWPNVLDLWLPAWQFRLHEFPWRAALGIESEGRYLSTHIREYEIARMVERNSPPGAQIFSLMPVAKAYVAREIAVTWQSAVSDRMTDAMRMAALGRDDWYFNWKASWAPQPLRALRFRMPHSIPWSWDIGEVQLYAGDLRISDSPQWTLRGWPDRWGMPLAFDGKRVTLWQTEGPARAGMFLEVDLDHPQMLSSAVLLSHTPLHTVPLEFFGQGLDGKWRRLTFASDAVRRPPEDLRLEATSVLFHAGFRYLLAPTKYDSYAPLGRVLQDDAIHWGLEQVGEAGPAILFRIR